MAKSSVLGYPRIGKQRELKRALERYWAGESDEAALQAVGRAVREAAWRVQAEMGIDFIPCNDFSFYDHVLDTACLFGLLPERFGSSVAEVSLPTYFAMARGAPGVPALELTKWFDTNYHYLVPEFDAPERRLASVKPFEEFAEATGILGRPAKPVLLGPLSFILLGKRHQRPLSEELDLLLPLYSEVLERLAIAGAEWVQLDEPVLVQDRSEAELQLLRHAYQTLGSVGPRPKLLLQTYYGSLDAASWNVVMGLPIEGVGLDFVRDDGNRTLLNEQGFPQQKVLAAGVVNGRNVWRTNLVEALEKLEEIAEHVPSERLWVQPSCTLLHLPHDVRLETRLPENVRALLAFAEQRLEEVVILTRAMNEGRKAILEELERNAELFRVAFDGARFSQPEVRERLARLTEDDFRRPSPYEVREPLQRARFQLPLFPTTTIGSYPQTPEVRQVRARWRAGKLGDEEYGAYIRQRIAEVIRQQEEIGLDVLVHGEYERPDMVEYFAEQLEGFILTDHGWVQSYGSRVVRPPIIFGDVKRPKPMTVEVSRYAQSLTSKPVKGMLTGPVTILNWSFVREDIPRREVAYQIALALRDEVQDLEAAGIGVIQIDEPALREGLPLRRKDWADYLDWAVRAFRLASSGVRDETQIHSHMCYSEFQDIIEAIDALDADVISIENSRSQGELLQVFQSYRYSRQIGPGVYDVHSARIPSVEEITALLERALQYLRPEQLWVNPDCGLKTRRPEEVWPSLRNMVEAARGLRERYAVAVK